jgi:retron-type reverse transcriptase
VHARTHRIWEPGDGFRPKRSPHQALDALTVGIETRRVNWVLDADIQRFFDTLKHEWLVRFLEHRVGYRRVVRLIQKWLRADVLKDGERRRSEVGTVRGSGSISPLLANVYLHYVFDLCVQRWRRTEATATCSSCASSNSAATRTGNGETAATGNLRLSTTLFRPKAGVVKRNIFCIL